MEKDLMDKILNARASHFASELRKILTEKGFDVNNPESFAERCRMHARPFGENCNVETLLIDGVAVADFVTSFAQQGCITFYVTPAEMGA